MNTEAIGSWAGLVWTALNESNVLGLKQLKKITKLKDKEVFGDVTKNREAGDIYRIRGCGRDRLRGLWRERRELVKGLLWRLRRPCAPGCGQGRGWCRSLRREP